MDAIKVAIALLHCEITVGRGEKLTVRVTKPPFLRCIIDDEFKESETSHNETIHTSDKINGFVKVSQRLRTCFRLLLCAALTSSFGSCVQRSIGIYARFKGTKFELKYIGHRFNTTHGEIEISGIKDIAHWRKFDKRH